MKTQCVMDVFTKLTAHQASLIENLLRSRGVSVAFLGLDQNELPVIQFRDVRRVTEPFAIRRSVSVTEPALPVRWLTEQELDAIEPSDAWLLTQLKGAIV